MSAPGSENVSDLLREHAEKWRHEQAVIVYTQDEEIARLTLLLNGANAEIQLRDAMIADLKEQLEQGIGNILVRLYNRNEAITPDRVIEDGEPT